MPRREENPERNERLATAILNKKARPNRLIVEESVNDDNSVTVLVRFFRAQVDDGINWMQLDCYCSVGPLMDLLVLKKISAFIYSFPRF